MYNKTGTLGTYVNSRSDVVRQSTRSVPNGRSITARIQAMKEEAEEISKTQVGVLTKSINDMLE